MNIILSHEELQNYNSTGVRKTKIGSDWVLQGRSLVPIVFQQKLCAIRNSN